jgi:3-hydroxypropanoate dehydrogenase
MKLSEAALDQLFRDARSYNGWQPEPIPEAVIRQLYELAKLGPTSANGNPARYIWAHSTAAKAKIAACVFEGNVTKVSSASVVVIIGFDLDFYRHFGQLMPFAPEKYRQAFSGDEQLRHDTAFRNSSLQGAYLIMAARSIGYDCGPMSGFDNAKLDQAFFSGTTIRSNFLCCIGRGDRQSLKPRNPRFDFEQVNEIV